MSFGWTLVWGVLLMAAVVVATAWAGPLAAAPAVPSAMALGCLYGQRVHADEVARVLRDMKGPLG